MKYVVNKILFRTVKKINLHYVLLMELIANSKTAHTYFCKHESKSSECYFNQFGTAFMNISNSAHEYSIRRNNRFF